MKTSTQIFIDNRLVKPIISALNIVVRLVGQILQLNHDLSRDFKTIAICKYKGMGSIIQSGPLIRTLRNKYPDARIIFVSTEGNRAILEEISEVDKVILLNDKSISKLLISYPSFITKLIKARIGVFIDLEIYSNFSSLNTTLSMARNRFGFYLRSSQYRMGIYTHMMFFNAQSPIMQAYLQMARLLGSSDDDITHELLPFKTNSTSITPKPYLVINPNASDLRIERRWPANYFKELILKLREEYPNTQLVLIGSASEANYITELLSDMPNLNGITNLAGKTNLKELITLISHAESVITNDTGPMHISAAQKTPTIALFGPCSPKQYGSLPTVYPIYKSIYCSPCVHEFQTPPCWGDNQCMKKIVVEDVMQTFRKLKSGNLSPSVPEPIDWKNQGNSRTLGQVERRR